MKKQTNSKFQPTNDDILLFALQGWSVFHNTDINALQVQRIDDVLEFKDANKLPFTPPLLKSDDEARRKAAKYYLLNADGIIVNKHAA